MRLQPFALESDVDEALRLFQVSTFDAAMSGGLSGAEGFTPEEDIEEVRRLENLLKKRFAIGSQVSQSSLCIYTIHTPSQVGVKTKLDNGVWSIPLF